MPTSLRIHVASCLERGIVTPAPICDHVEPHKGDVIKVWTGELQSLCLDCHLVTKRQIEELGYRRDVFRPRRLAARSAAPVLHRAKL